MTSIEVSFLLVASDDDISLEDLLEIAKKNDIKNPNALLEPGE